MARVHKAMSGQTENTHWALEKDKLHFPQALLCLQLLKPLVKQQYTDFERKSGLLLGNM